MKMFLISDNVDTYTGMRLAGVDGVVVHEREELYEALQNVLKDKTVGIVLLTEKFGKEFPDRFYDVGIEEEHAVTFCAGMASRGLKPVFAVYSTFLQRGFDQILHDTAIGNYPVLFALDRSGW